MVKKTTKDKKSSSVASSSRGRKKSVVDKGTKIKINIEKTQKSLKPKKKIASRSRKTKAVASTLKASSVRSVRPISSRTRSSRPIKKKKSSSRRLLFLLLILLICAVTFAGVFYAENKFPKDEQTNNLLPKNNNQKNNQPVENATRPNEVSSISQNVLEKLPNILLLDKISGKISTRNLAKNENTEFYSIKDKNLIEARYNNKANLLAYAYGDKEVDRLKTVDLKTNQIKELESTESREENITDIPEWSPNGIYVTYSTSDSAGCNDTIVKVQDKNKLLGDWCYSTRWSNDGRRIMVYNYNSMATSSGLYLNPQGTINSVMKIELAKLKGDSTKLTLAPDGSLMDNLVGADFIDANRVALLFNDDSGVHKIFVYNDASKEIKLVTTAAVNKTNPFGQLNYLAALNSVVLSSGDYTNDSGMIREMVVSLADGSVKEFDVEALNAKRSRVVDVLNGQFVVLNVEAKDENVGKKIFLVDAKTGNRQIIADGENVSYVGIN